MLGTLKDEAEVLRFAVRLELVGVAEVTEWAARKVEGLPEPHWTLCELASTPQLGDLRAILGKVPGDPDPVAVERLAYRLMSLRLTASPTLAPLVADILKQIIDQKELEKDRPYGPPSYADILNEDHDVRVKDIAGVLRVLERLAGDARFG